LIFKIARFLPLLAALALCSGCVTSKTPVGDKAPALDPKVWNGKWRSGDGGTVRTRIKDARLGIVEMRTRPPLPKQGETHEILVRSLGPLVIANQKIGDPHAVAYQFGRVAIDNTHLVVFNADESVFAKLIKRHQVAGQLDKDKHGKLTGSCTIEGFSGKAYRRLKKEGFDVRSLFKEDPSTVLVRDSWHLFWW
jgi:hypothetical protein